jgi:hypothetical protein
MPAPAAEKARRIERPAQQVPLIFFAGRSTPRHN